MSGCRVPREKALRLMPDNRESFPIRHEGAIGDVVQLGVYTAAGVRIAVLLVPQRLEAAAEFALARFVAATQFAEPH